MSNKFVSLLVAVCVFGFHSTANASEKTSNEKLREIGNECKRITAEFLLGDRIPKEALNRGWTPEVTKVFLDTFETTDKTANIGKAFFQNLKREAPDVFENMKKPEWKKPKIRRYKQANLKGTLTIRQKIPVTIECDVRDYGEGPFILQLKFRHLGAKLSLGVPVNPKPE